MTATKNSLMATIKSLMEEKGVRRHEQSGYYYYTSYVDLYDWELYFDTIALAYVGGEEIAIQGLRLFCEAQKTDGFISRRILQKPLPEKIPDLHRRIFAEEQLEHCKPFLFQTSLIISRTRGNVNWLRREDYDALKKYLDHWLSCWDRNSNGLCEWSSAPHSGSDTQLERIGPWRSRYCEGVDLNCFIVYECQAAAYISEAMGETEDSQRFRREAHRRSQLIRDLLWDDQEGFFYDRDARTGKQIKVKSAAAFLTLWAGVATPAQAQDLVQRYLLNPEEFWRPFPISSYARSEPSYTQFYIPKPDMDPLNALGPGHANWCGGMWPHWNYQIVHGLIEYGFKEEAGIIADKLFEAVSREEGLFEWYDAETGAGQGLNPFWAGASIMGVVLPEELRQEFNPSQPDSVEKLLKFETMRSALGIDSVFNPKIIH